MDRISCKCLKENQSKSLFLDYINDNTSVEILKNNATQRYKAEARLDWVALQKMPSGEMKQGVIPTSPPSPGIQSALCVLHLPE